jgi:hypothetical protein
VLVIDVEYEVDYEMDRAPRRDRAVRSSPINQHHLIKIICYKKLSPVPTGGMAQNIKAKLATR